MMPKSTAPMRPSTSTSMFPGCWSPWKKPSRNAWLKKIAADVVTGGEELRAVIHPDAGDALLREDAALGAAPVDRRQAIGRVACEVLRELDGRGRLEPQVHLQR